MRLLAVDSQHGYFFLGCTNEEVNRIIIPHQENLLERYRDSAYPTYYVSSIETRESELAAQAKIKKNPYQSRTRLHGLLVHEEPTFDAYVVVNSDLTELYFVPYDYFYPERWGNSDPWGNTIKRDIQRLIEVTRLPMVNENGDPYSSPDPWTNGDAEALLVDYEDEMDEWKKHGPRFVYKIVMAQYQLYHFSRAEVEKLLHVGGVIMPPEWYRLDSAHQHVALHYLKKGSGAAPEPKRFRSTEEELARLYEMDEQGYNEGQILAEFYGDYLDGLFTWETFMACVPEEEKADYEDLQGLSDEERRRKLWRFNARIEG